MKQGNLFINDNSLSYIYSNEEIVEMLYGSDMDNDYESVIINHIKLVISIVNNRFKTVNYDKRDLVSVGIMGLINAVYEFDKDKGVFKNYAEVCIANEILKFLKTVIKDERHYQCRYDKLENQLYFDDILDDYLYKEKCNYIYSLISELSGKKKDIIIMYFGFFGNRRYTQAEIASIFNVSQSYISKVIIQVINEFRCKLSDSELFEEDKIYRK